VAETTSLSRGQQGTATARNTGGNEKLRGIELERHNLNAERIRPPLTNDFGHESCVVTGAASTAAQPRI